MVTASQTTTPSSVCLAFCFLLSILPQAHPESRHIALLQPGHTHHHSYPRPSIYDQVLNPPTEGTCRR